MFRAVSLLAVALWASAARAQAPAESRNLKVLPKDLPKQELMQTMRGFAFSLGVRCQHCHAAKEGAAGGDGPLDFASDALPQKETARAMLRMVQAINGEHLAKLAGAPRVACVTCHHGLAKPRTLDGALGDELAKSGTAGATALYRELRKKYYGGAQYDFGETALNQLGEALLAQGKAPEAAAMMELNAEVNAPLSGWGVSVMAMAHEKAGALDKAMADYRRALELNPKNEWARGQLEALGKKAR